MSKIPRTFCVTLKETPLRTKGFKETAEKAGIEFEFVYGMFGHKLGLVTKSPNSLETSNENIFMTNGQIGCALSHLMLWKMLLILPEDEFFIVEDDAEFVDGFKEKFQAIYAKLPLNWELAYVGWIPYGKDIPPIMIDEGISIRKPSATHAYLVKKSTLEKLISSVCPIYSPIDLTILHKLLPTINYYVFDPTLIHQKSYLSSDNPVWTSMVYDWDNDLYGVKHSIIKEMVLTSGWYGPERNGNECWRWSKEMFSLKLPTNITAITLVCTTPIDNQIILSSGDVVSKIPLRLGSNVVVIPTHNSPTLDGKMSSSFVPSQYDPNSQDARLLGICLKKIIFHIGEVNIEVGIEEFGMCPPPMAFKL